MEKIWRFFYCGLFLAFLVAVYCLLSLPDGKLHVFVLDVGQGDSILIQTPGDEYILIDGGPDDKVMGELAKIMPFYERTVDLVILTHPHPDHINGIVDVLKRFDVREVMMTGVSYNYPGYNAFLEQVAGQNIHVIYAGNGSDYKLGSVVLDMLYPFTSFQGRMFENQNNGSIVFRLLYGKRIYYFPGDLELEGEQKLIASTLDLSADFFKAAHHGSRTSNSSAILDRIRPQYAVISAGAGNKYGHPHPETLDHLKERGVNIFRTDLDGIVESESDGETLVLRRLH